MLSQRDFGAENVPDEAYRNRACRSKAAEFSPYSPCRVSRESPVLQFRVHRGFIFVGQAQAAEAIRKTKYFKPESHFSIHPPKRQNCIFCKLFFGNIHGTIHKKYGILTFVFFCFPIPTERGSST